MSCVNPQLNVRYDLLDALELVRNDYVVVRVTDGTALCSGDGSYDRVAVGHITEKFPMRILWNDVDVGSDVVASAVSDDGTPVWTLAPSSWQQYAMSQGNDYPYAYVIME